MTSDTINAIRKRRAQLDALRKMLERGEHVGAGLTIGITVGPMRENDHEVEFEVSHYTAEILGLLIESLSASLQQWLASARRDAEQLIKFLSEEGNP